MPTHGLEGALRLRDQWLGVWEQSITIEEIWGRGDDVFLTATLVGQSKATAALPSRCASTDTAGCAMTRSPTATST